MEGGRIRSGWERRAIALTRPRTYHIKNTRVIGRTPKTFYSVLSKLFLIPSFSALLITLFLTVFNFLFSFLLRKFNYQFFMQLLPVKYTYTQLKS